MKPSREFIWIGLGVSVIGIAAIVASYFWNVRSARDVDADLYIPPEVTLTREMKWLQEYVRIDTSNPPGNESDGAEFLAGILEEHGIEHELIESAPGRGSVYARLRGRRSDDALLLLHHIDVVPATDEGWRFGPFSGEISQGYLWGRGTLDMKGIGIAHLAAFLELAGRPEPPARDVIFLGVADEEQGSLLGVQWLLDHRPDVFDGVTHCLNEGGITEMIRGEVKYFGVEVGSMAMSQWRFEAPDRRTVERARIALEPFLTPVEPAAIEPTIEEYYAAVAPHRIVFGEQLQDIRRAVTEGDYFRAGEEYRFRMEVRVRIFPIEQSGDGWSFLFDAHAPPAVDFEQVSREIRSAVPEGRGTLTLVRAEPVPPFSSTDSALFELIGSEARAAFGAGTAVGPYTTGTVVTDSRFLRARGVTCYGFWPFPVDFFSTQALHSIGERVRLDYFQQGVEMMVDLVDEATGDNI